MPNSKTKYIAYSLWGDNPLYTTGMIRNVEQAAILYPEWQIVVYFDDTVPPEIIHTIQEKGAITINKTGDIYGMFWRFYAADLDGCTHVIFRDSDSRLTMREKLAVDEWLKNDDMIHIMRDHPHHHSTDESHAFYILGGLWGIKGGAVPMQSMISSFAEKNDLEYGSDQFFLNEIYSRFKSSCTVHDEFFDKKPFPIKRKGFEFIGERIDINEQPYNDDRQAIKDFYRQKDLIFRIKKRLASFFRSPNS
ncbi:hypothetical protein [Mucilaginibacter sp. SG564]|uniref:hypothetical protein n=1 Tax=Mucilaginibacter sp. SG564 TaxID=2587022 RepID=UPI001556FED8|nr:hypothetical protein [Mucilaginibacter sp. SG564]NOW98764.1 hypothetical protein [Mucilaginibacter sp. SG564]